MYTSTVKRKEIPLTNAGNALENRLRLLLSEALIEQNIVAPKIYLAEQEISEAKLFLTNNGIEIEKPLVMVGVLGSSLDKTLPFNYMAQIIDVIEESIDNVTILFNYIPSQKNEATSIYELVKPKTKEKIHFNVYAKSLRNFLALVSLCDVLVGNEGGAVNMAKALSVPTFTVFSPWINKEAWNMFEDGKKHLSVHLQDYKPEFYEGVTTYKKLKDNSASLYRQLKPSFYIQQLEEYLLNLPTLGQKIFSK